jgi:Fic family protein
MTTYRPPCTVTPEILSQVAEIAEQVGRLSAADGMALRLRRVNRIRTIHGSLAIEGNTLSEAQITAILEGRRVMAPSREIQEVRNAAQVYEWLPQWTPHQQDDLLTAHKMLMEGLLDSAGRYRSGSVGVMGQAGVVHIAPPAERVPELMVDLLHWLQHTDLHPLVAGSIFHYEFEFIHPFADGNGRMGRLWHTLILCRWQPLFADLPTESMIHARQQDYYHALNQSTSRSDAAPFVSFMLEVILSTLEGLASPQVAPQVSPQVEILLAVLQGEMSRSELMQALGLTDRKSFRQRYLLPALQAGLIEMTLPDKPKSRLQKYRLKEKNRHKSQPS